MNLNRRELVILTILHGRSKRASAVDIQHAAQSQFKHDIPNGALYTTLQRLGRKRLVSVRGERRDRTYKITKRGVTDLNSEKAFMRLMLHGK